MDNLKKEEELISEFADNPEYHLEKASNLIEMSLIVDFPQELLHLIEVKTNNLKVFDYKDSFLSKATAEFGIAISLRKKEINYHIKKAINLEKVIIAIKLLKKASIGKLEGYVLIPNVAGKEIIPNYLYDFIKHEILEEYDTAVELERSEEMKSSHIHSKIIFLSRVRDSYAAINEIERCLELYPQTSDFHYHKAMELIKESTNELGRGANEIYKECL